MTSQSRSSSAWLMSWPTGHSLSLTNSQFFLPFHRDSCRFVDLCLFSDWVVVPDGNDGNDACCLLIAPLTHAAGEMRVIQVRHPRLQIHSYTEQDPELCLSNSVWLSWRFLNRLVCLCHLHVVDSAFEFKASRAYFHQQKPAAALCFVCNEDIFVHLQVSVDECDAAIFI